MRTDSIGAPRRRREKPRDGRASFDINETATRLILEHGSMILRDARRYSTSAADAEDAYQRALEILLTKAPSDDPKELVPWLRTVVRHEAMRISKTRNRTMAEPIEPLMQSTPSAEPGPAELLEDIVAGDVGGEALQRLKPDQVQCLLAQSQGYTYTEIAQITGFTARKVTRCIADGRRAFVGKVIAIESGSECERIESLLQLMADGDSYAHVEARPHLRNCASCRATLAAYRSAPSRVAALVPLPLVILNAAPEVSAGMLQGLSGAINSIYERIAIHASSAQQWAEVATMKKAGVVVATVATLSAGSVAVDHAVRERPAGPIESVERSVPSQLLDRVDAPKAVKRVKRHKKTRRARTKQVAVQRRTPQQPATPTPVAAPAPSVDDGSSEFLPEGR